MPSQSASEAGRWLLVAAGTAHFTKLRDSNLQRVPEELERISSVFATLGYERLPGAIDPDRDALRKLYSGVKKGCADGDTVVAYYTAHGVKDEDRYYLLTRESDLSDLDETALPAEDLARALTKGSKASQVLVIIDACYAGAGASEFTQVASHLKVALRGAGGPTIFILAAARPKQEAEQGALSLALSEALAKENLGGRVQPYLFLDQIVDEIGCYLAQNHPCQDASWDIVNYKRACRLFPNPRHRTEIRPGLDLESQRAFTEHWVPKARGGEIGIGGWYFTGREQALRELAAWLGQEDSGGQARVVTGGPGCGKSAVLARVVTLADANFRRDVLGTSTEASLDPETLPPEGVVDVAVHARHKLLADVVAQIADAFRLNARHPAELIAGLVNRREKTVIVVDALDEADERDLIASGLLRLLLGLPWVFLLIGTRPDSAAKGQRFRALGESAVEIDLDAPRYIDADDVTRYVERRLLATEEPLRWTPYREAPNIAGLVARAVAQRANSVFLVAHAAVQALLAKPSAVDIADPAWIDRLPTGIDDAFDSVLAELGQRKAQGLSAATARSVLTALAFAKGEGLPWGGLWSAVATAIAGSSVASVGDSDIHRVVEHAAPFIVEALENERSVYRLYHERVAEHLRDAVDTVDTERRIVAALRLTVPVSPESHAPDWVRAHPYIRSYLLSHALAAADAGALVADGAFVAASEPVRMVRALARAEDPLAQRAYAAYAIAFANLPDLGDRDRAFYLEMAARKRGDNDLADLWKRKAGPQRWSVPWAHWFPLTPHRVFSVDCQALCAVVGELDGHSAIVLGGSDGTIRVLDLSSGAPIGEPLRGHNGEVTAVTLDTLDGNPVIVSGEDDGTIRIWDFASKAPLVTAPRGHMGAVRAVALSTRNGLPVIFSTGDDGSVRLWDPKSDAEPGTLSLDATAVNSITLCTLDRSPMIVLGSSDGIVDVWEPSQDIDGGVRLIGRLDGHNGPVEAVATGVDRGCDVIAVGGREGLEVWDCFQGDNVKKLTGDKASVKTVMVGSLMGDTVIVAGRSDGVVDVWTIERDTIIDGEEKDIRMQLKARLHGHDGPIETVAFGTLEGRQVIVVRDRENTIRVWDGDSLPHCSYGPVEAVAFGTLGRRQVILSGGPENVRVWDPVSGVSLIEPLWGPGYAPIALGTIEGRAIIVSGGNDGAARVYELGSSRGHERVWAWDLIARRPTRGNEDGALALGLGMFDGRAALVSVSKDGTVRIRDLWGSPLVKPLRGRGEAVNAVALSTFDDRTVIVSGGKDGTVRVCELPWGVGRKARLWDLNLGAPRGHEDLVQALGLGMFDGRAAIVSVSKDGTVRIRDLGGSPLVKPLRGRGEAVNAVALSTFDDRTVIVSGGKDGTVRIWDPKYDASNVVRVGTAILALASTESGTIVVAGKAGLLALQVNAD